MSGNKKMAQTDTEKKRSTGSSSKKQEKKGTINEEQKRKEEQQAYYEMLEKEEKLRNEIKLILVFAVMFLFLISNFGLIPPLGNYLSYFMFGMTGILGYLLPVLIFVLSAFLLSNQHNKRAVVKAVSAAVFVVLLMAFLQLLFCGYDAEKSCFYYYFHCGEKHVGGGFLGALIVNLLGRLVGNIGTAIILIVFMIIAGVIFTERSFIGGVRKGSKKIYKTAREDAEWIRDTTKKHSQKRAEQKKEAERKRKVYTVARGVELTKLDNPDKQEEEMHEISEQNFKKSSKTIPFPDKYRSTDKKKENAETRIHTQNQQEIPKETLDSGESRRRTDFSVEEYEGYETYVEKKSQKQSSTLVKSVTDVAAKPATRIPAFAAGMQAEDDAFDLDEMPFEHDNPEETGYQDYETSYDTEHIVPESNVEYERYDRIQSQSQSSLKPQTVSNEIYIDEEGNYKPKEKIMVSKEAAEIMERPAYGNTASDAVKAAAERAALAKERNAEGLGPDGAVQIATADVEQAVYQPQQKSVTAIKESAFSSKNTEALEKEKVRQFVLPKTNLLNKGQTISNVDERELEETAVKLEEILRNFGVKVSVTEYHRGPSVTRYEIQPEIGIRLNKITTLADDIKLNLAATDIRIEPIPGKSTIGIEVPNKVRESVLIRDLIESRELINNPSKIAFAAGKDIAGQVITADIAKMPHFLIAGTTGSGKSVFTNSIIMSILFRAKPDEVRLIIVDPKVVEFGIYNGIPHLLQPVVTDAKLASNTLKWAVAEMQQRYRLFEQMKTRDLKGYNQKISEMTWEEGQTPLKKLPQIVIVIDELADLMMVAAKEVEESICRLAQLARAAGIHLIIATQRPSVDVVTGLIKANIPSRCALMVSSGVDSRTIIDSVGAEKLLGNGDMLFYPSGYVKPVRLQGAFVSDAEVQRVVEFWTAQADGTNYDESITQYMETQQAAEGEQKTIEDASDGRDEYFWDAAKLVVEKEKASTSMLQRMFKIGFNRAARIIDQLEESGIIGAEEGTKPRKVLISTEELEEISK